MSATRLIVRKFFRTLPERALSSPSSFPNSAVVVVVDMAMRSDRRERHKRRRVILIGVKVIDAVVDVEMLSGLPWMK